MPNWCYNRVTIMGNEKDLQEIKELVEDKENDTDFSFEKIKPLPKDLEDGEWYNWCINNWGTKWDATDAYLENERLDGKWSELEYTFDTAWSPAKGIYNELTERFPDVSISWFYDEPGMQFAGYLNN